MRATRSFHKSVVSCTSLNVNAHSKSRPWARMYGEPFLQIANVRMPVSTRLSGPGGEQIRRRFETHEWNLQDALLTRLGDEEFKWRLSGQLLLPSSLNIEYDAGKLLQLTRVLYECRAKGLKCILFTQVRLLSVVTIHPPSLRCQKCSIY